MGISWALQSILRKSEQPETSLWLLLTRGRMNQERHEHRTGISVLCCEGDRNINPQLESRFHDDSDVRALDGRRYRT